MTLAVTSLVILPVTLQVILQVILPCVFFPFRCDVPGAAAQSPPPRLDCVDIHFGQPYTVRRPFLCSRYGAWLVSARGRRFRHLREHLVEAEAR